MKALLDTNILLDLVAKRHPFFEDIKELCIAAAFGDVQLWLTTQSYADAYYVLSRKTSTKEAKRMLLGTLDTFLTCGTYAEDLKPAFESSCEDVEDYMIVAASKHIGADFFVTRDEEIKEHCSLQAMNARELLSLLQETNGCDYAQIEI